MDAVQGSRSAPAANRTFGTESEDAAADNAAMCHPRRAAHLGELMSHVKAGGTSKNTRDSQGQRLGVKLFGGQAVKTGQVIVRQVGATKRAGSGTSMSRNFTIHAARDGVVKMASRKVRTFSGRSVRRTEVTVE